MTERVSRYLCMLTEYEIARDGRAGEDACAHFVEALEKLWHAMTDAERFAIERELVRDLDVSTRA